MILFLQILLSIVFIIFGKNSEIFQLGKIRKIERRQRKSRKLFHPFISRHAQRNSRAGKIPVIAGRIVGISFGGVDCEIWLSIGRSFSASKITSPSEDKVFSLELWCSFKCCNTKILACSSVKVFNLVDFNLGFGNLYLTFAWNLSFIFEASICKFLKE